MTEKDQSEPEDKKQEGPESPEPKKDDAGSSSETSGSKSTETRSNQPRKNTWVISAAGGGAAVIAIVVAIVAFGPFEADDIGGNLPIDNSQGPTDSSDGGSSILDIGSDKEERVVVAEVNDADVTLKELKEVRQTLQGRPGAAQIDNMTIVETLVERELLLQEAEKRGLTVTSQEAEEQLNTRLERSGRTLENFTTRMEEQGRSYDKVLGQFGNQIAIQELQKQVTEEKDIEVTDEQAREYYEQNKEKLLQNVPPQQRGQISFETMKGQLKQLLVQQQQQKALDELTSELRKKAEIKIYEDKI